MKQTACSSSTTMVRIYLLSGILQLILYIIHPTTLNIGKHTIYLARTGHKKLESQKPHDDALAPIISVPGTRWPVKQFDQLNFTSALLNVQLHAIHLLNYILQLFATNLVSNPGTVVTLLKWLVFTSTFYFLAQCSLNFHFTTKH